MNALEQQLFDQIMEAGLPAPVTQFRFASRHLLTRHRPPRHSTYRWDFCWPLYRVCVDLDGGTWLAGRGGHTSGSGVEADRTKDAEAAREGWTVLRVTKRMVKSGYALTVIGELLDQGKKRLRREDCALGRDPAETV